MSDTGLTPRTEEARAGKRMQLVSGRSYWPADPRAEEVELEDIAHALALSCRFGGQCLEFYSVAEHSVNVSYCVAPEYALDALMHDAPEAYIGDVIRPVKDVIGKVYHDLEDKNWSVIARRFALRATLHESIKAADDAVLAAERLVLKPADAHPWEVNAIPAQVKIACYSWRAAKKLFLDRFYELAHLRAAR